MERLWELVRRYGTSALIAVLLISSFALSWFPLPFVVVHGSSMQPTYETGDLVLIEPTAPSRVQKGDIVVVDVPHAAEQEYGYPDMIIHRVMEVHTSSDTYVFRTKGDNTGEDPFAVYPQNLAGRAGQMYPDLGFVLLYLRSIHGKIFIFSVFLIELIYSTAPTVRRSVGAYIDRFIERHSPSQDVAQKVDDLDQDMQGVEQSLTHFADAMDEYATHLESHTTAVQNLAQAADEIRQSVERQSEVLDQLEESSTSSRDTQSQDRADASEFEWIGEDEEREPE